MPEAGAEVIHALEGWVEGDLDDFLLAAWWGAESDLNVLSVWVDDLDV